MSGVFWYCRHHNHCCSGYFSAKHAVSHSHGHCCAAGATATLSCSWSYSRPTLPAGPRDKIGLRTRYLGRDIFPGNWPKCRPVDLSWAAYLYLDETYSLVRNKQSYYVMCVVPINQYKTKQSNMQRKSTYYNESSMVYIDEDWIEIWEILSCGFRRIKQ